MVNTAAYMYTPLFLMHAFCADIVVAVGASCGLVTGQVPSAGAHWPEEWTIRAWVEAVPHHQRIPLNSMAAGSGSADSRQAAVGSSCRMKTKQQGTCDSPVRVATARQSAPSAASAPASSLVMPCSPSNAYITCISNPLKSA